jgi:zinc transporter ZupT
MIPFIYGFAAAVGTLLGGLLPLSRRLAGTDLRYLTAFAAGGLVSVALFKMVPEGGAQHGAVLAAGFFAVYLLEKLVLLHSCGEAECEAHALGWVALPGIILESLVDGIAIAAGYALAPALGLAIGAAVFLHEVPRGFFTTVIMRQAGYGRGFVLLALLADAVPTPIGTLLPPLLAGHVSQQVLAFAAGTFLSVGASDLLPEAHRRFNLKVVGSVIGGALVPPVLAGLTGA